MTVVRHIDEFLRYMRYEKGASEHTLDAYGRDSRQFCQFMGIILEVKRSGETAIAVPSFLPEAIRKSPA